MKQFNNVTDWRDYYCFWEKLIQNIMIKWMKERKRHWAQPNANEHINNQSINDWLWAIKFSSANINIKITCIQMTHLHNDKR
jgi:hypothetical protein